MTSVDALNAKLPYSSQIWILWLFSTFISYLQQGHENEVGSFKELCKISEERSHRGCSSHTYLCLTKEKSVAFYHIDYNATEKDLAKRELTQSFIQTWINTILQMKDYHLLSIKTYFITWIHISFLMKQSCKICRHRAHVLPLTSFDRISLMIVGRCLWMRSWCVSS